MLVSELKYFIESVHFIVGFVQFKKQMLKYIVRCVSFNDIVVQIFQLMFRFF